MRIIRFLFTSLVFLSIFSVIGYFLVREGMLIYSVARIRTAMQTMRRISSNSGVYIEECRKKGVVEEGAAIGTIQLRFTSETDFRVEVICTYFTLSPITVEEYKLPPLAKKLAGQSGIIWGPEPSGITIDVWGRQRSIMVDNFDIVYPEELGQVANPQTVCSGYGYSCCQEVISLGEGTQLSTATDCPRSCFSACVPRPLVLTFNAEPFYNPTDNSITISSGQEVNFGYVVKFPLSPGTVMVSFGDGQQTESEEPQGTLNHVYECPSGSCQFKAELWAEDTTGRRSAQLPTSTITVKVN